MAVEVSRKDKVVHPLPPPLKSQVFVAIYQCDQVLRRKNRQLLVKNRQNLLHNKLNFPNFIVDFGQKRLSPKASVNCQNGDKLPHLVTLPFTQIASPYLETKMKLLC